MEGDKKGERDIEQRKRRKKKGKGETESALQKKDGQKERKLREKALDHFVFAGRDWGLSLKGTGDSSDMAGQQNYNTLCPKFDYFCTRSCAFLNFFSPVKRPLILSCSGH